ncbi:MAG: class I SAM-dependent methyltransferase [Myxococcaceae bacterium]
METAKVSGTTSAVQGPLWSERAEEWRRYQENAHLGLFEAVLNELSPGRGARLLDVGCGSGLALERAAARGAAVSGLDASSGQLEQAKARVPAAELKTGDLEALPFDDGAFDFVTGFNAFQYAARPVAALKEARRVLRPGGRLAIASWGAPERCEATPYLNALKSFMPPPPPGAPSPVALSAPGVLESLCRDAGLEAVKSGNLSCAFEYPDTVSALRGLLAAGPAVAAIARGGEGKVQAAVLEALAPYRTSAGGYRLENEFRFVIAKR